MAGEGKRRGKPKAGTLSRGEKRLLRQLLVCLLLFAAVFGGRGVDWEPMQKITATVESWVQTDTDFQAVFARMGEAFSNGEPAVETFKALWDGVTGEPKSPEKEPGQETPADGGEATIV